MHCPSKPLTQADEAVIRTIAGVLIAEDQAVNLHQPPGIGQRARPGLSEFGSPGHMRNKPMSVSPSHRNQNYFNTSNTNAAVGEFLILL